MKLIKGEGSEFPQQILVFSFTVIYDSMDWQEHSNREHFDSCHKTPYEFIAFSFRDIFLIKEWHFAIIRRDMREYRYFEKKILKIFTCLNAQAGTNNKK